MDKNPQTSKSCVVESGFQLFSRLTHRPSLDKLHPAMFPEGGPLKNEIIQISGEPSTGKTTLVIELIARCILPMAYGGKNSGAVLISTDHHFHILKLIDIMETFLQSVKNLIEREKIIKKSLTNFLLMSSFDSMQLNMTWRNLDRVLDENVTYNLVVIDSISAYYWTDRAKQGIMSYDKHCLGILRKFKEVLRDRNVVGCFTRKQEGPSLTTSMLINRSYFLKKNANGFFLFNYDRAKDVTTCKRYVITKNGLNFAV